jgi:2-polyprenyl-3-methyl-5-hydroxy-6-metoxy-1,4-benzoquinol methylase
VLDLGCANGATGAELKRIERADRVVGVEIYEPAAQMAAAVLDRVIAADLEALPGDAFSGEEFDVILCSDILEHLRSPVGVLRALTEYLLPGGLVLAHLPNIAHHSVIRMLLRGSFDYADGGILDNGHLRFFAKPSIVRLFQDAGLTVEMVKASYPKRLLERHRTPGYHVRASKPPATAA